MPETPAPSASLEVVFDLRDPGNGIGVDLHLLRRGGSGEWLLERIASPDEVPLTPPVATFNGHPVALRQEGAKVTVDGVEDLHIRYTARPGGLGRHGHQGFVADEWVTFDGRLVLRPDIDVWPLTVRYLVPEGWNVASPHRREGNVWIVDEVPQWAALEALTSACVAVGKLSVDTHRVGDTRLEVWTYDGFDAARTESLRAGSLKLGQWFHEKVGFDTGVPFVLAWLPRPEDAGVFGGAWTTGACYEGTGELREWQLLGHRFAHPMNKYPPAGVMPRDARDHWFVEGFASWVEIEATVATGLDDTGEAWNRLYTRYVNQRWRRPGLDRALSLEPTANGDGAEFLHYVKGPLVVREIDRAMKAEGASLLETVRGWTIAGGRYNFRDDLVWRAPAVAAVLEALVDQEGFVLPVDVDVTSAPGEPAVEIDGTTIGVMEVAALLGSGELARFDDLFERLARDEVRRRALARTGSELIDRERLRALDPRIAVEVRALQASVPMATPSGGCSGTTTPLRALPAQTASGRALSTARSVAADLGPDAPDLQSLTLRALRNAPDEGGRSALAIWLDDGVRVEVRFSSAPPLLRFELLDGDDVVVWRDVDTQPGWHRAWAGFDAETLTTPGVKRIRVRAGERVLGERVLWVAPARTSNKADSDYSPANDPPKSTPNQPNED